MSESQIQSAFTDTNKEAASSTQNSEQDMLLDLRKKIAELESMCEKLQEEKNVLECRIEQRHMQVCVRNSLFARDCFWYDVR